MIIGLFLILTAWLVPGLPLWYSIITTVIGSAIIGFIVITMCSAAKDRDYFLG